jgi:UDP-N-acetylglucosamine:LPS N-acetylglucosamine transferase
MPSKKVLFISGSVGLGHITRDLAIADELRRQNPDVEISWLAAHPASMVIKNFGENLVPEADCYGNDNVPLENSAKGLSVNIVKYAFKAVINEWLQNLKVFIQISNKEKFDLVIGDESWEIWIGMHLFPKIKKAPFVMIFDFIGIYAMTKSPFEKMGVYFWNIIKSKVCHRIPSPIDLEIFAGEPEDIPDEKFGFLLPNRLEWAKARCKFSGYMLSFDPLEYSDQKKIRNKLGYGNETLIICSIGGTSVGKLMLELCAQAFTIIKQKIPTLCMILVCGPRLSADSLILPQGIKVKEYIKNLYEHLAACDLAIVQGGGTTTLELTALKKPFLYFPIEEHCEQEIHVAKRIARHNAGVKMKFSETTPELLAEKVMSNVGKDVNYTPISTNGAQKAAELINQLL